MLRFVSSLRSSLNDRRPEGSPVVERAERDETHGVRTDTTNMR